MIKRFKNKAKRTQVYLIKLIKLFGPIKALIYLFFYKGERKVQINHFGKNLNIHVRFPDDIEMLYYVVIEKYHLSGANEIKSGIILDLGSNIGITCIDYAIRYPKTKIIGFEIDEDNYKIALNNTKQFSNIHLFNKAISASHNKCFYDKTGNFDSYSISTKDVKQIKDTENLVEVQATTLDQVVETTGIIEFCKMDIEGEEIPILLNGPLGFLRKIKSFNIEIHNTKFLTEIIKVLEKHGFEAEKDNKHWSTVLAKRKKNQSY